MTTPPGSSPTPPPTAPTAPTRRDAERADAAKTADAAPAPVHPPHERKVLVRDAYGNDPYGASDAPTLGQAPHELPDPLVAALAQAATDARDHPTDELAAEPASPGATRSAR